MAIAIGTDGITSDSIDEGKRRVPIHVLDPVTRPRVLNPVLVLVVSVGGSEADGAVVHGEAETLVGHAVDAAGGLGVKAAAGLVGLVAPVEDLPALGVAAGPFCEREGRGVPQAAAFLVAEQSVKAHVDVVYHADAAQVPAQVAALRMTIFCMV